MVDIEEVYVRDLYKNLTVNNFTRTFTQWVNRSTRMAERFIIMDSVLMKKIR